MFRSIAMVSPDRRLIVQIKLASYGFADSMALARKIDTLYTLCEQLLTTNVSHSIASVKL